MQVLVRQADDFIFAQRIAGQNGYRRAFCARRALTLSTNPPIAVSLVADTALLFPPLVNRHPSVPPPVVSV